MKAVKIFILFMAAVFIASCSGSKENKVENVNYTTVYSISSASGKFFNPLSIIKHNGKIYMLDRYADFIKVFDDNGSLLYSFGKEGKGPGEMEQPTQMAIANNKVIVSNLSAHNYNYYTLDGKFIKSVPLIDVVFNFSADEEGGIYSETKQYINIYQAHSKKYIKHAINGHVINIDSIEYKGAFLKEKEYMGPMLQPFYPDIMWSVFPNGNLMVIFTDTYTIKIYTPSHKIIKQYVYNAEKTPVTEKDKEMYFNNRAISGPGGTSKGLPQSVKNKTIFPAYMPYVSAAYLDRADDLTYLLTPRGDAETAVYDLFDSSGNFVKSVGIEKGLLANPFFYGNTVYDIKETGDGDILFSKLAKVNN
jgi:hypothetical protein